MPAVLALALVIAGCAAPGPDRLIATLTDPGASPSRRIDALDRLGPIDAWPDPAAARERLAEILWSDRQPDELRIRAADRLLADDPAALRAMLDEHFLQIDRWPVMQYIFGLARQNDWRDFTPLAIRSYARPSQKYEDLHRPERGLIAHLHPGRPVEEVLLETFIGLADADQGAAAPVREDNLPAAVAAWTVLNRLAPPPAVRAMLASSPPATALVVDLQAAAEVVDALPSDSEAVRWLMALRAHEDGQWWRRAAEVAAALTPVQRTGLALRHLPILLQLPPELLAADRAALIRRIEQRLAGAAHVTRTEFGAVPGPASEAFADYRDDLAWADLAAILTLLDVMDERGVVTEWFVQADADLLDTRTEYGGVLAIEGEAPVTRPFAPVLRLHDRKFYSSNALIGTMYAGLAHYHFHAQKHNNAAFAGPGGGDLRFADRLHPNALVLTFIDRNVLNVDYYQPGGVAIDLGVIRR